MLRCLGFIDLRNLDEPTNLSVHFDFQRWDLKFGFEFRFQISKPSVTVRCDFSQFVYLAVKTWAQKPSISNAERRFLDQCASNVFGDILERIEV